MSHATRELGAGIMQEALPLTLPYMHMQSNVGTGYVLPSLARLHHRV